MYALNNINGNDEFFISAYTEINAFAEPTANTERNEMRKTILTTLLVFGVFSGCSENKDEELREQVQTYFDKQIFKPYWETLVFQMINDTEVFISDTETAYLQGTDNCLVNGSESIPCLEIKPESIVKDVSFVFKSTGKTIQETLSVERTDSAIIVRRPNGFPIRKK